jgi:subtilisin-like proprotein convertase family protein
MSSKRFAAAGHPDTLAGGGDSTGGEDRRVGDQRASAPFLALGFAMFALWIAPYGALAQLGFRTTSGSAAAGARRPARPSWCLPPCPPPFEILYDQYGPPSSVTTGSQDFETALDANDDEGADDFVVPAGEVWSIQEVDVAGAYFNGDGPTDYVIVSFFQDDAGSPGATACHYPYVGVGWDGDYEGSFYIGLPLPCVLGPGAYWVSVQARMNSSEGQWGWRDRILQSNNASMWRNPGDGYGTGCTDFTTKTNCLPSSGGPDFVFDLGGVRLPSGGVRPPPPSGCPPLSIATAANTDPVPIPDLGTATSTIEVSGVESILWDLNLQTFIRHTSSSDLVIKLTSPAGTTVTISSNNGGAAANVFNGTVWDDQASAPATLAAYNAWQTSVSLGPEEPLSAFRFENPNGTWTLTVQDTAPLNTGSLDSWSLEVTTLAGMPGHVFLEKVNSTPMPIPDGGHVASPIVFDSIMAHSCGVSVTTDITHPAAGELIVNLISPRSTTLTLTTFNGGENADVFHGTEWRDDAGSFNPPGPVTDTLFTSGVTATPLAPQRALGALDGENPNGTWTLSVSDTSSGNGGTLNGWSLKLESCVCGLAVPTTPVRMDRHAGSGSSNLNGVLEIGESAVFEPSWMNPESFAYEPIGFGSLTGPAGPTYTMVDDSADYGILRDGAVGNCWGRTGDCYEVQITGSRPSQHFDATLNETLGLVATPEGGAGNPTNSWTLHVGESFADAPTSNPFYGFIENVFHNGVTGGCNATDYCPDTSTLRQQMAVFVLKAKQGSSYTPPACTGLFSDVPCPSLFADWIEELANRGVVTGCGGGNYCPTNPVLRQQMAVFLLKTLLGAGYTPPSCTGVFADVPCPSLFADWIEDLYNRSIAAGCGGGNFCPISPTTRGQMAPFLVKTFGLSLYEP